MAVDCYLRSRAAYPAKAVAHGLSKQGKLIKACQRYKQLDCDAEESAGSQQHATSIQGPLCSRACVEAEAYLVAASTAITLQAHKMCFSVCHHPCPEQQVSAH